jgi:hypothetical protein
MLECIRHSHLLVVVDSIFRLTAGGEIGRPGEAAALFIVDEKLAAGAAR